MTTTENASAWPDHKPTALLVLADGTVLEGFGLGAEGHAVGEVCFNTAMTGYEEILTDPSYAGQLITFTFPHIGNVGTNDEDIETVNMAATPGARGVILRAAITDPVELPRHARISIQWLKARGIIGLSGIDTRALTALIRSKGMPNAVIAHAKDGQFDLHGLKEEAREWPGLEGMDLVPMVTSGQRFTWDETPWAWEKGFGRQTAPEFNVVAIDYGIKRNILRLLAGEGCKITVVPATTSAEDILAMKPDGVFLSNGPGDPAETGKYAVPVIQKVISSGTPTFGICLGHQMLGLAVGAKTKKMHQGHHGANHPVKDETTGKVEITSMNHGFAVDQATLPEGRDPDPHLAVRRLQLRHPARGQAGVLGAVSPGSLPRPAQFALSVQAVRRSDAGEQGARLTLPTLHASSLRQRAARCASNRCHFARSHPATWQSLRGSTMTCGTLGSTSEHGLAQTASDVLYSMMIIIVIAGTTPWTTNPPASIEFGVTPTDVMAVDAGHRFRPRHVRGPIARSRRSCRPSSRSIARRSRAWW